MVALPILVGNSISGTANSYSLLIQVDSVIVVSLLCSCNSLMWLQKASDAMPPDYSISFSGLLRGFTQFTATQRKPRTKSYTPCQNPRGSTSANSNVVSLRENAARVDPS